MKDTCKQKICRRAREEVTGGSTIEKSYKCSWYDLNLVLNGWKRIKKNYKNLGLEIFQSFLHDHPSYKSYFPSFSDIPTGDLIYNESFKIHSNAIMQGLNKIMENFSAAYEEENEILPVIGFTHKERGITETMMNHLKETICFVFGSFLKSDRREKIAWNVVLDLIFEDYICRVYPKETKEEEE